MHHVRVMRSAATAGPGARADDVAVTFVVADPARALAGVRLRSDLQIPADLQEFRRDGDSWVLAISWPPVTRMEYLLELRPADGGTELVTDPGNPVQVAGAFGPKSVLEFPSYAPPAWLSAPAEAGHVSSFDVPTASLDGSVGVHTWAPAGTADDEPLPVLIVHDGPEYDTLASLTRYLSAGVTGDWLPRLRAALLSPGPRDRWYSANPQYAHALRHSVLPAVADRVAVTARVGLGTSLGGLAMLHAYCLSPGLVDALFLQSGSFFTARLDSQESRFRYFRRITRFVAGVHAGGLPDKKVPVVLTCGTIEENVENNRLMLQTLRSRGYPASLHEVPDLHNYTAWRDAFDPHLTRLLNQVCS